MLTKKLPVGIDSFEKLRKEDFYYVDKTGLIADIMQNWGKVNLFTRPRRFGKTLNMSMLKSFFEIDSTKPSSKIQKLPRIRICAKHTWANTQWCSFR